MSVTVKTLPKKEMERRKRIQITKSAEFQKWLAWRRTISPFPSDPYRAYMIDRSLYARRYGEEYWRNRVNRADIRVDYPYPSEYAPAPKPSKRRHRRPTVPRQKKKVERRRIPRELEQRLRERMEKIKEQFIHKYHLPPADIVLLPHKTHWRSHYNPLYFGKSKIVIGIRGLEKMGEAGIRQLMTSFKHELGHHIDIWRGWKGEPLHEFYRTARKPRLKEERLAWKVAEEMFEKQNKAVQKWHKRWALGSYLNIDPFWKERKYLKDPAIMRMFT